MTAESDGLSEAEIAHCWRLERAACGDDVDWRWLRWARTYCRLPGDEPETADLEWPQGLGDAPPLEAWPGARRGFAHWLQADRMALRRWAASRALFAELAPAAKALFGSRKRLDWLAARGIDALALRRRRGVGPIGVARVSFGPDGRFFSFDEGGQPAIVQPAWAQGVLVDLVAWTVRAPGRPASRRGVAQVLGGDAIDAAAYWGETRSIAYHPAPMDWLIAGGDGVAPASVDRVAVDAALRRAPRLLCADEAAAEALHQRLAQDSAMPVIAYRETR